MRYSRIIDWLKLGLPLTAVALMLMVFAMAKPVDPSRAIPLAQIDVLDRARDPRLTQANYAGVTSDGSALTLDASTARSDPDAQLRFNAEDFEMSLDNPATGEWVTAQSLTGQIDRGEGVFLMVEDVVMTTDQGYVLNAPRVQGLMDATWIEAADGVEANGPIGFIRGDHGVITRDADDAEAGFVMVFTGGVRLIYRPDDTSPNPAADPGP